MLHLRTSIFFKKNSIEIKKIIEICSIKTPPTIQKLS